MNHRSLSAHHHHANKELLWFSTDNEDGYRHRIADRRKEMEASGLIDAQISYKFNSLGFRSEELVSSDNAIMFLGGSEVLGTGVPIHNVWASIVAESLGMTGYNLGQSGGANDSIYRLGSYWIPKLKPKIVIALPVPPHRLEIVNTFLDNPLEYYLPARDHQNPFFKTWLSAELNGVLNEEKNRLATNAVCAEHNTKIVWFESLGEFQQIDMARDLVHKGVNSNANFARRVLSKI